jgi:threonine synthase
MSKIMIRFRKRTLKERFLRLFPKHRKRQDDELREAITYLVKNPDELCEIEGEVIVPSK